MSNFDKLNELLQSININDVTPEDTESYEEIPDGYYLCETQKAELTTTKETNLPMVKFQFKVVENGLRLAEDGYTFVENERTKNRFIFINYVLKDEKSVKKFVSDALKFQDPSTNESILTSEYFTNAEILPDALDILVGLNIYISVSTSEYGDKKNTWKNPISWERAEKLELPN